GTRSVDITVTDVDPARKSDFPVDDDDLSVIAIVQSVGEQENAHSVERIDFDAGVFQFPHELPSETSAAECVVDKPHFHSLSGFFNEDVLDLRPDAVFFKNVILDVNV